MKLFNGMRRKTRFVVGLCAMVSVASAGYALTIVRNLVTSGNTIPSSGGIVAGNAPVNSVGGGTLTGVFDAAADSWQALIGDNFTLTIDYGWGTIGGSTLAFESTTQYNAGSTRIIRASIVFDNDGSSVWFTDATPTDNAEYGSIRNDVFDLGGGSMNVGRVYGGATGFASGRTDLLSVAKHEIGHALGLDAGFSVYQAEAADNKVNVTSPLPYAGAAIPVNGPSNAHVTFNGTVGISGEPDDLMVPGIGTNIRRLQSDADVLAVAQISGFTNLNLASSVPEPTLPIWMATMALVGGISWVRRRK